MLQLCITWIILRSQKHKGFEVINSLSEILLFLISEHMNMLNNVAFPSISLKFPDAGLRHACIILYCIVFCIILGSLSPTAYILSLL